MVLGSGVYGFWVEGSEGSGFIVLGLGCMVLGSGFMVFGLRVQRVQGL